MTEGRSHPSFEDGGDDLREVLAEVWVFLKEGAETSGDGEDPLSIRDIGQVFFKDGLGERSESFGVAGGTEPAPFAGKGDEAFEVAVWAP